MKRMRNVLCVGRAFVLCSLLLLMSLVMKIEEHLIRPQGSNIQEEDSQWWRQFLCAKHQHPLISPLELPTLHKDIIPSSDKYNIYLVESSCVRRPAYRSFCSVESYAHQNPSADVWYVMITSKVDDADGLLAELPKKYPNLHLVTVDLDQLFQGIPTHQLFVSRKWMKTNWLEIHLSDLIRMALLKHTGGLYSDTDTVCMKDMTHLKNFIGVGITGFVNNAIFHFDRHHRILQRNLEKQNAVFNGETRGVNGLVVLTDVVKETCNFNPVDGVQTSLLEKCPDISIQPNNAFYKIPYTRWVDIFQPGRGSQILKTISSSYVVHTWGGITALSPIVIGNKSLYDLLAASFCPLTRRIANSTSGKIRYYGEALPGRAWHKGIGKP